MTTERLVFRSNPLESARPGSEASRINPEGRLKCNGIALGSEAEPSARVSRWRAVPEDAETPVVACRIPSDFCTWGGQMFVGPTTFDAVGRVSNPGPCELALGKEIDSPNGGIELLTLRCILALMLTK